MKNICKIILPIVFVAILFGSCTHNNGDIGPLFGNWKLEKAEYQNMEALKIDHPMYWAFQNSTFRCIYMDSEPEGTATYGNFRLEDNTLFLSFPDSAYPPPSVLNIPAESEWQLLRLTHSEMTVRYSPTLDSTVTLYFNKW